jgi:uncharacterized membrane protein
MKRKSNPISLIAIVFIIGVISSFVTSDFQIGSLFGSGGETDLKTTLDTLNLVLAGFVLAVLLIYFFYRAAKSDHRSDSSQDFDQLDD